MTARRVARLVAVAANTFHDHSPAEKHQQNKGNPVVPLEDKLAGQHAESPADQRGQGFNHAKNQPGADGF